jgi:hypothetical protein
MGYGSSDTDKSLRACASLSTLTAFSFRLADDEDYKALCQIHSSVLNLTPNACYDLSPSSLGPMKSGQQPAPSPLSWIGRSAP